MYKTYRVKLVDEERAYLESLLSAGKAAARTRTHARILLKADEGPVGPKWTDEASAEALDVNRSTVERVRQRCVEEGFDAALRPRPSRQLRLRKLDGAQEAQLVAVACARRLTAAIAGPCSCWLTSWSNSRSWTPSHTRRCARH
jgi:hypothetical protein